MVNPRGEVGKLTEDSQPIMKLVHVLSIYYIMVPVLLVTSHNRVP